MAEWCMAHPWMTFFLIWAALRVLDAAITNVFRSVNNVLRTKMVLNGAEVAKLEERGDSDV